MTQEFCETPVSGFIWSYIGTDGKERFNFSSFGATKTKATKHFNAQNNLQRLEPIKRHKLYAVSMTVTTSEQGAKHERR
jgi:hypothetical protein